MIRQDLRERRALRTHQRARRRHARAKKDEAHLAGVLARAGLHTETAHAEKIDARRTLMGVLSE